jgi:hypothetical protein
VSPLLTHLLLTHLLLTHLLLTHLVLTRLLLTQSLYCYFIHNCRIYAYFVGKDTQFL